jgi:hypothetical protein
MSSTTHAPARGVARTGPSFGRKLLLIPFAIAALGIAAAVSLAGFGSTTPAVSRPAVSAGQPDYRGTRDIKDALSGNPADAVAGATSAPLAGPTSGRLGGP